MSKTTALERLAEKMLAVAKATAEERDLPFEISLSDVSIPVECPILGIPIVPDIDNNLDSYDSPIITTVVPQLGFTPTNTHVISVMADLTKGSAEPWELDAVIDWLTLHSDEEDWNAPGPWTCPECVAEAAAAKLESEVVPIPVKSEARAG